ncbi:hypothetical protein Cylst_4035 [Cylindrospermum stagnale PCC 7417]|uniref:HicB-like antitoxin of toxin-antitoxin system domain-containing protein n=1 Tax=Cylindrospermum stagnale PCC 7417 TaxID=56107 RepID=K9X0K5_9NOST|nr:type II toxin-antitoxin system HicB family antitoxin [Cylindrospermum stagnale]AFZ26145.1 hypothetical protein Cylst_4035 [Cylindrospermum stagnale PCC 7417]
MENSFTAVFEKVDDWYIGYVQELPGANVQEKTLEEARESLREAIELILISNRELTEQQLYKIDKGGQDANPTRV